MAEFEDRLADEVEAEGFEHEPLDAVVGRICVEMGLAEAEGASERPTGKPAQPHPTPPTSSATDVAETADPSWRSSA